MRHKIAVLAAGGALAAPACADAHVSVHPNAVPAGANATLAIRVPNETDNARTVKLQVKLPPGFIGVSTQPPPGWTSKVLTSRLAKPVQTDDGPVDTQVSEVVWTAKAGAGIPPGQFANFPIAVALPGRPGQTLTFKTLQTYSNGQVARWIGGAGSDQPAPTIDVTAKGGVLQDVAGGEAGPGPLPAATKAAPVATRTVVEKQSADNTLAAIALVVGLLGLAAGGAGLAMARRARAGQRIAA